MMSRDGTSLSSSNKMAGEFERSSEDEIGKSLTEKECMNTQKATKRCKILFEEFLRDENVLSYPKTTQALATILQKFYAEVKRKDGKSYTKSSLCAIRFGLSRHLKERLNADIIKDKEFYEANRVYEAQCEKLKKRGLGTTEHKPAIVNEDIKKLYHSGVFNTANPTTLQNKVFFEVMLFFGRGGRQSLRQLKKNDFEIKVNFEGKRYVVKTKSDEPTKSHLARDTLGEEGVMIANDGPFCPVSSFEKYLSHLNPFNEFLFQRPRLSSHGLVWYDNMVVGEQTLGKKMKDLSQQARLSKIYTNYSVKATNVACALMALIDSASKKQLVLENENESLEKQDHEKSEKEKSQNNETITKDKDEELRLIEEQRSVINFYSRLTGVTVSCDNTSQDASSFQSFNCTFYPDANCTHGLQFRLTHDKEFDEIEYSPNPRSPGSEKVLKRLPDYLQENIFFGADQAPNFLTKLLKTAE